MSQAPAAAPVTAPAAPAVRIVAPGRAVPAAVWALALLAALVHMWPYFRAELETPPGWSFTGNVSVSPDYMQYRVWMRQAVDEGPVVSNRFTAEANPPYIPVPFYHALGVASRWTGLSPEWTYAWAGAGLAVALVLLLWVAVRRFLPPGRPRAWVMGALLVGGGLGGWIQGMRQLDLFRQRYVVDRILFEPLATGQTSLFEDHRGHYVLYALRDSHFLLLWAATVAALLVFHSALVRPSRTRTALAAAAFAAVTWIHVYEGVTLAAIALLTALLCRRRGVAPRASLVAAMLCAAAAGAVLLGVVALVGRAGLPPPPWRGPPSGASTLLIGFPVALPLAVLAAHRLWRSADADLCFLFGWAGGCLAFVLASPFYPYPDRGILTLQVPLFILAGAVWFDRHRRVGPRGAAVLVLLMGSSAAWFGYTHVVRGGFFPDRPYRHLDAPHREAVAALEARSAPSDLLVAGGADRLWLAPAYDGRHYAGHFFLTVDYERREGEVERFLADDPAVDAAARAAWLRDVGATLVWVGADDDPRRFARVPGLRPVLANAAGTLFAFRPDA